MLKNLLAVGRRHGHEGTTPAQKVECPLYPCPSGMESLVEQIVITGIRFALLAWNTYSLLRDANMARLLTIEGINALRNGDRYAGGGYLFAAVLAGASAVL